MVFRALYLIAIVLVVDGHTTLGDMFSMGGLFRNGKIDYREIRERMILCFFPAPISSFAP